MALRRFAANLLGLWLLLIAMPSVAQLAFEFPEDGQTLDLEGAYLFELSGGGGASNFDWRLAQGTTIVDRSTNEPEFALFPGEPDHSRFVEGAVRVTATPVFGSGGPGTPISITINLVPRAGQGEPAAFGEWRAGDVHSHAAGDRMLQPHRDCRGLNEEACAQRLVRRMLEAGDQGGLQWMIFTEHGTWLGIDYNRRNFPLVGEVSVTNFANWNGDQARSQFFEISDAIAEQAGVATNVRPLIGQELGTSLNIAENVGCFEFSNPGRSPTPGHFGAYFVPQFVTNSHLDCDETSYLRNLEIADAWGGVNHPDNGGGINNGASWKCWFAGDPREQGDDCSQGVTSYARNRDFFAEVRGFDVAFRSIEIINENHLPTAYALDRFDQLLQDGWVVAALGGGDVHTVRTNARLGQDAGDLQNLGRWGKTLARLPQDITPGANYDPAQPGDPVRRAIRNQQTIATNGPIMVPQLVGVREFLPREFIGPPALINAQPGDEASIGFDAPITVRVDWGQGNFRSVIEVNGNDENRRFAHVPNKIVIVIGEVSFPGDCEARGTTKLACPERLQRLVFEPTARDRERGYMAPIINAPSDWNQFYVRVEYLQFLVDGKNAEFVSSEQYALGAISSPIYVHQDGLPMTETPPANVEPPGAPPSGVISGTIVDTNDNPLTDAEVVLWRRVDTDIYVPVRDNSAILLGDTRNPANTANNGEFQFEVLSSTYRIEASRFGCQASGGGNTVTSAPLAVGESAALVLDCTPPVTVPLSVNLAFSDGANETLSYTVTCGGNEVGVATATSSAPAQFTVPLGSACTIVQAENASITALSGESQQVTTVFPSTDVYFVNAVTPRPASAAFELVAISRTATAADQTLQVACNDESEQARTLPVGGVIEIDGLAEGDICTASTRDFSGVAPIGPTVYAVAATVMGAPTTIVLGEYCDADIIAIRGFELLPSCAE